MKIVFSLVLITIFFTFIQAAHAQSTDAQLPPPDREAYYCQGNSEYHQSLDPLQQDDIKDCATTEQCIQYIPSFETTLYSMAACVPTNSGPASWAGGTGFYFPEAKNSSGIPGTNFETDTKLEITSDKKPISENQRLTCHDTVNAAAIKATNVLTGCQVTHDENNNPTDRCGCDFKNIPHEVCTSRPEGGEDCTTVWEVKACGPEDWHIPDIKYDQKTGAQLGFNPYDDKQCFTEFSCLAEATGINNIAFSTAYPKDCDSNATIAVQAPKACNTTNSPDITIPNQDPNNTDIIGPSLDIQERNADLWTTSLLPPSNVSEINQTRTLEDPVTTIDAGFFTGACKTTLGKAFLNLISGLTGFQCPTDVNFNVNNTKLLFTQATSLNGIWQPPNQPNIPAQADCNIQDARVQANQVQAEVDPNSRVAAAAVKQFETNGNQQINDIQTSISNIYIQRLPPEQQKATPLPSVYLSSQAKAFKDDQRLGKIAADCANYRDAHYPPGTADICSNNAINSSGATINPTISGSNIAACQFTRSDHNPAAVPFKSPVLLSYFQEVAQNTSVPAVVLAAFARIEVPGSSDWNDDIVNANSTTANLCPINPSGASGIMQLEPKGHTGYDGSATANGVRLANQFMNLNKTADNLTSADYCNRKEGLYIGAGFILGKLKELGFGDGTKWDPNWSQNQDLINKLVTSFYGCLKYPSCASGPHSYGDDLMTSIKACKS